jgi:hypothetical protein
MSHGEWIRGPFGLDAGRGQTLPCQRTVLVVVHHLNAATRLTDIVPLLETDWRIQVVFTVAPSSLFAAGAAEFLARLGGVVVPWQQACQSAFDLAVAASPGLLEQVHAPVLTVPHGTGHNKYPARWDGPGPAARRETTGLELAGLVYRGRVIPSRIIVPTRGDAERLGTVCPPAGTLAVVGGDTCFDRLMASLPLRAQYRQALGVGDRKLVAVTSTWGPGSLFRQAPELPSRLATELPPDEYRVALFLHPHVWTWHSRRQVTAWLSEGLRHGLVLVPPEEGWRAVLTAADTVIGDHGSASSYAAGMGVPLLLAAFPDDEVDAHALARYIHDHASGLRLNRPLEPQLRAATAAWDPAVSAVVRSRITDMPGGSARVIRRMMYELMKLPEPASAAPTRPVPLAGPVMSAESAGMGQ